MTRSGESLPVRAARGGIDALLVVSMMIIGSLVLWAGVPLGWLWIGSQVQAETGSVGSAIAVMLAGVVVSVLLLARLLLSLSRWHEHLRERSGKGPAQTPLLEMVLVVTAAVAVVAFGIWFFIFTGPGPSLAPTN